ncbi:MAG TPA: hypothetical protein VM264_04460 [Acidimicrobiales bacterium]|jgi:hypothetical protein|nr:hypothetical protein [Acidimicrobiales bacterium]
MAEKLEHSIWDGAGNEIKVVTTENENGIVDQGTGPDTESATADALAGNSLLGKGYETAPETRYSDESHHADENPTT